MLILIKKIYRSIRDMNRVMNAFKFKYKLMEENVNSVDLMAITVLQIYAPEIYEYGRMGAYSNSGYQLIDESNIDEIEQILLKKINELIQTNGIYDYVKPEYVCGMWQYLDKEAFGIYINELVDNPKNILRCLHSSMQKEGTEGANGKLMGQKDNEDSDFLIEEQEIEYIFE